MNTTTKTMIAATLIILISNIAAAEIQENWPYGQRNPLPDESYIRFDFESGGISFNAYPNVTQFMNFDENKWGTARVGARGYHIYPKDFFHNLDGSQVNYIYIVNGECGAHPMVWRCTNINCDWWPGSEGMIHFPDGASDVSFLVSTGKDLEMLAYDKNAKLIGTSGVAHSNTARVPPNPSEFTRVSFKTSTPIIYAVIIRSSLINFWVLDDLVIGGLTFPDEPVNYTYVARRAQELHGVDYLEYGLGHDYLMLDYMDVWQFTDGMMGEYWNPETKTFEEGEGISNAGLIVWAYNYDATELAGTPFVKRNTVAGMAKHDFKVDVDPANTQPGDVCFMDRDFDGYADEVYMVVEETSTGMDLICSCPDEGIGVIYSKKSISESSPAFMGYKRLPGVIRGGPNPIPKGH
jgi:hypothetical protein